MLIEIASWIRRVRAAEQRPAAEQSDMRGTNAWFLLLSGLLAGLAMCPAVALPPPPPATSPVTGLGRGAAAGCMGVGLRALDITIPLDPTAAELIAVFYSFVPWVLALVWVVMTLVFRSTQLLLGVLWAAVVVCLNEFLWKKIVSQSRPAGSCLHSKGMPSTHSELAFGMFVW